MNPWPVSQKKVIRGSEPTTAPYTYYFQLLHKYKLLK